MKQVTAYKCDFCSRCFLRIVDVLNHERRCNNNPQKHHCKTCIHGTEDIVDWIEHDRTTPIYGPWCKHFNVSIHDKPYLNECETKYDYIGQAHEVPWTCDYYEYKGFAGFKRGDE